MIGSVEYLIGKVSHSSHLLKITVLAYALKMYNGRGYLLSLFLKGFVGGLHRNRKRLGACPDLDSYVEVGVWTVVEVLAVWWSPSQLVCVCVRVPRVGTDMAQFGSVKKR